jgi:hypothetical protein
LVSKVLNRPAAGPGNLDRLAADRQHQDHGARGVFSLQIACGFTDRIDES